MSYEIIYDKQFVKLSTGDFIPVLLWGSNNCYDVVRDGKERRSRSWEVAKFISGDNFFDKPDGMIKRMEGYIRKKIDEYTAPEYWLKYNNNVPITQEEVKNHFGFYFSMTISGKRTMCFTAGMFKGIVVNGIKNALSIDELKKQDIYLRFNHFNWHDFKFSITPPKSELIDNEEMFWAQLKEYQLWKDKCIVTKSNNEQEKPIVFLSFSGPDTSISDSLYRIRLINKQKQPSKPKQDIAVERYYVLQNSYGYLIKYTSRGYKYSYSEESSSNKAFITQAGADKYLEKIKQQGKHMSESWVVLPVNRKKIFRKSAA